MKKFYCYIYTDPKEPGIFSYKSIDLNFAPIYVGKGQGKRYRKHIVCLEKLTNLHFKNKLKKILSEGFSKQDIEDYILVISCSSEQEAFNLEKQLIKEIGRSSLGLGPLVNWTDGGEGTSGHICSEETKRKMSKPKSETHIKKMSESKAGKKRKPFSEETKKKMSEIRVSKHYKKSSKSMTGENHPMFGKHHSIEARKKMSESHLGKKRKSLKVEEVKNKK